MPVINTCMEDIFPFFFCVPFAILYCQAGCHGKVSSPQQTDPIVSPIGLLSWARFDIAAV